MALLNDFSGGKNTRVTPNMLRGNEAQVYTNIDNISGALRPIKGLTDLSITVNKHFTWYYGNSEWVSFTGETSFVEFQDKLYYTRENDTPVSYDGTDTFPLGIEKPATAAIADYSSTWGSLSAAGNLPEDTYEYIYSLTNTYPTFRTIWTYKKGVVASGHNAVSVPYFNDANSVYRKLNGVYYYVTLTGNGPQNPRYDEELNNSVNAELDLSQFNSVNYNYVYTYYNTNTDIESQPSEISNDITFTDTQNMYVNLTNISPTTDSQVTHIRIYRLGGTLTEYTLVDTIAKNSTTYTDTLDDEDIVGNHILDTYDYAVAKSGLKYLVESNTMLFGSVGDKLYYSNINKPWVWPVINFIDFDATIVGIGKVPNGLVVFTSFQAFLISGNSPNTFSKHLLSANQGCISHYSIQFTRNTLIWLSSDGLCSSSGGLTEVISMDKLGPLTLTGIQNSAILDRAYYLVHSTGVLVFDFKLHAIIREIDLTPLWIGSYNDTLYFNMAGALNSMLTGNNLTYKYKSPVLTEGSHSHLKKYKEFYIKYNGDITIKTYFDGVLTDTKTLTGNKCYNLKTKHTEGAYGLEIEIEGTGEVTEIEYKVQGRQNGK